MMEQEIKIAIYSCIPMVLLFLFFEALAPLSLFLLMFFLIIYVVMFLWSITNIFVNFKNGFRKAFVPILVFVITAVMIPWVGGIWNDLDYSLKSKARQEVVSMIRSGKVNKNENGYVKLPRRFINLSKGGTVDVRTKENVLWVEFRTSDGWLDEFEGIIYTSNDKIPPKTVFFWSSSYLTYEHKSRCWFYYYHE